MIVIILLTMDVTHEYDECFLVFEQDSLHFLSGLYSCFCQKMNKTYKKNKPAMLYSDRLYFSASNILILPCVVAALPPNCTAASRLQTPLGTAV